MGFFFPCNGNRKLAERAPQSASAKIHKWPTSSSSWWMKLNHLYAVSVCRQAWCGWYKHPSLTLTSTIFHFTTCSVFSCKVHGWSDSCCSFTPHLMHIVNRNSKLRFGWPAGLYLSTSAEMSVEFECWGKRLTHICSWFEYGLQRFIVVVGLTVAHLSTYLQVSCSCVVIQYLKTCRWMRKRNYPTYAGGKKNYSMILRWGWFVFWHHCFTSFT